ncbi:MAG: hypothetical protein JNK87_28175, partial [Bryobacterales bacterium]|nr:hypothetical protein [Bryobacterales bacterium]
LAAAAGTTRQNVLLSCIHPHDAPYTDRDAQSLLDQAKSADKLCDTAFEDQAIAAVANAIKAAQPQPVTHTGTGSAKVEQVASNRRYVLPDGRISFGRTSATRDPNIRNQPEGLIDPQLKTISFFNGDKPLAALHCYSTHPMSYYGQGDVTPDFPGLARRRMQSEHPGIFQIYLSGASGDTMAGRYTDGNTANRQILADRLYTAMQSSWKTTQKHSLRTATTRNAALVFKPRPGANYTREAMRATLASKTADRRTRLDAALGLSWLARLDRREPIDVPALHLGPSSIVLVPAEAFVQYQLWAQQDAPNRFVMTLGYSECAPGYIPTNDAVKEGYDDHYSWVDFATCEAAMRRAIREALRT